MTEEKKKNIEKNLVDWQILQKLTKYLLWFLLAVFVSFTTYLLVFWNSEAINQFIIFLQALQIIFLIVIGFCFYKLQDFRKRYLNNIHEINHLFAIKNLPKQSFLKDQKHELTEIWQARLQTALKSTSSHYPEEWRFGLVELDKLLKDLLVYKGYMGETLDELLQDAKLKNFSEIENAFLAHKIKIFLTKNMVDFPKESESKTYANVATLYKVAINALMH